MKVGGTMRTLFWRLTSWFCDDYDRKAPLLTFALFLVVLLTGHDKSPTFLSPAQVFAHFCHQSPARFPGAVPWRCSHPSSWFLLFGRHGIIISSFIIIIIVIIIIIIVIIVIIIFSGIIVIIIITISRSLSWHKPWRAESNSNVFSSVIPGIILTNVPTFDTW